MVGMCYFYMDHNNCRCGPKTPNGRRILSGLENQGWLAAIPPSAENWLPKLAITSLNQLNTDFMIVSGTVALKLKQEKIKFQSWNVDYKPQ